jgi:glycosyltransferase involved in cell wall biosynthesis
MKLALCFTNFGPYHLARLRALGQALREEGGALLAYETAGREERYPWLPPRGEEPFRWETLVPGATLEQLSAAACRQAMNDRLESDRPDAAAVVGYTRPESLALLRWACRRGIPRILMSESQAIDKPRVWWKEAIKARRVRRFSAALVGGPRHRAYLASLGFPAERIVLGYNAVDHEHLRDQAERFRSEAAHSAHGRQPYFVAVNRFVQEKNLDRLVRCYRRYLAVVGPERAWDMVLCGDGPERGAIEALVARLGLHERVRFTGFLQESLLIPWLAFASALIHASTMEPWGLVVNEAAACRVPLLVSSRAGCVETLVPEPMGVTGRRFDPHDEHDLTEALVWMTEQPAVERQAMGRRAEEVASAWGPARFARGTLEALELAVHQAGPARTRRPRAREGVS